MRIGILGGSFDPVHYGHLRAAQWSLEVFHLDRILLVPAHQSPFKGPCFASAEDRLAMLRLAVADNPGFEVEDCELRRPAPSFTIDTLRLLGQRFPENRLAVLVGSDAAAGLDKWREVEEVRRLADIRILGRPGDAQPEGLAARHVFEGLAISSTDLRGSIKRGKTIRYLTPESVRLYIEEKRLYK